MLKEQTPLFCWNFVNIVSVLEYYRICESYLSFYGKLEMNTFTNFAIFGFQNLLQWIFLWTIENVTHKFWFSAKKSHYILVLMNLLFTQSSSKLNGKKSLYWYKLMGTHQSKIITQKGKQLEASNFSKIFPKDRQLKSWSLTLPSLTVWKKMDCKN